MEICDLESSATRIGRSCLSRFSINSFRRIVIWRSKVGSSLPAFQIHLALLIWTVSRKWLLCVGRFCLLSSQAARGRFCCCGQVFNWCDERLHMTSGCYNRRAAWKQHTFTVRNQSRRWVTFVAWRKESTTPDKWLWWMVVFCIN